MQKPWRKAISRHVRTPSGIPRRTPWRFKSKGRPGERQRIADEFFREQRRALIEDARANRVTEELRDGKVFTVLRLEPQFRSAGGRAPCERS